MPTPAARRRTESVKDEATTGPVHTPSNPSVREAGLAVGTQVGDAVGLVSTGAAVGGGRQRKGSSTVLVN